MLRIPPIWWSIVPVGIRFGVGGSKFVARLTASYFHHEHWSHKYRGFTIRTYATPREDGSPDIVVLARRGGVLHTAINLDDALAYINGEINDGR